MKRLLALADQGRYVELEAAARRWVADQPDSGLGWKILGVSLRTLRKDALAALRRATDLLPDDAEAHSNLAEGLLAAGRAEEAVLCCHRALALVADLPEAHLNLGNAQLTLGRTQDAAASYRRVLHARPEWVLVHNRLGNALMAAGEWDAAALSYASAVERQPGFAQAHCNRGHALHRAGRYREAAASCRAAIALRPELAEAHNNLGNALRALGQVDESTSSYRRAIELRPDYAEALANLGAALMQQWQPAEAVEHHRRVTVLRPDRADAHCRLGEALLDLAEVDAAEASLRRALLLDPAHVDALVGLGFTLRRQGRWEEALSAAEGAMAGAPSAAPACLLTELMADVGRFEEAERWCARARALDPEATRPLTLLPALRRMTGGDQAWLSETQRMLSTPLPPRQAASLHHALVKYFDDVRDFESAFDHCRLAKRVASSYQPAHDREALHTSVDAILRRHPGPTRERAGGPSSRRPLFVIGMPRSGTSLAEQILASHPRVFGAGELSYWGDALEDDAGGEEGGPAAGHPRTAVYEALGAAYLNQLARLSDAECVVDKMPANFFAVGLIHASLPDARFIHLRRHPLDTCLSLYLQNFTMPHSYANDLTDLAHYYREYRRLMAHWRATLPPARLLEIDYESLVGDPERWSRRMVEFAGLAWDPVCLDFDRTARPVMTASRWQVRQKITRASVGRWRHYETFLGPLASLADSAEPA